MKNKLLYGFVALLVVAGATGCGKAKVEDKTLSIVCTSEKETSDGFESQVEATYNFDDNQYATDFTVTSTQKFDDKSVYDVFKAAQEETAKDTSEENVTYDLKTNDETMTLVFTMTVKNINVNDAETEEEKESLKASSVLKSVETEEGYACKVNGIDRSELK